MDTKEKKVQVNKLIRFDDILKDKVVWSVRYHAETQLLIAAYTYRLFHNSKNCDTISVSCFCSFLIYAHETRT